MANEKPEKDPETTPKGAVEVDEKDLDQAAGGASGAGGGAGSLSLNYSKIDFAAEKPPPDTGWSGPVTLPPDEQKKI